MQSTENAAESKSGPEVLRLMRNYRQMLLDDSGSTWAAGLVAADMAWIIRDTEEAFAAERDRADQAEAALAEIREYADDASEDVPAAGIDSILDKWEATE